MRRARWPNGAFVRPLPTRRATAYCTLTSSYSHLPSDRSLVISVTPRNHECFAGIQPTVKRSQERVKAVGGGSFRQTASWVAFCCPALLSNRRWSHSSLSEGRSVGECSIKPTANKQPSI